MASDERRLHPASPVFVLAGSLKQFAIPLVVLLLTGRGDRNEFVSAIMVGVLALHSIAQYFTFRFQIDADGVVIRSGILVRSVVHIPYKRIHNVSLRQSLFHRVFGVAEVELEAAGGNKPEGRMRVLSIADAAALEALIREQAGTNAPEASAPERPPARTLLTLEGNEIFRLGIINNRGLLIVGASIGAIYQAAGTEEFERIAGTVGRSLFGWSQALHLEGRTLAAGIAVLVVVATMLIFAFSILLALVQYDDFRLTDDGKRLRVERGLFTRVRGSLLRRRIQAYTVRESLFHRWLARRSLRVDSAAAIGDSDLSLSELVPIAKPEYLDTLVSELLGGRESWPPAVWKPLHPSAWRRRFVPAAFILLCLAGLAYWIFDARGLFVLALIPVAFVRARMWAQHTRYSDEGDLIVIREGWLGKTWRFAETSRLQGAVFHQSPFDRRRGMATVALDTAGAGGSPRLTIPWIPQADARQLVDRLMSRA